MTDNVPSLGNLPSAQEFQMFQTIAKNAQDSGLYSGVGQAAKIFMILLSARELGIGPMLALNGGIWNINGKVEISSRLMSSMIRRAGHKMSIKSTDKECEITCERVDTSEKHTEIFTWEMATKAGLVGKDVWKKYPEDMLFNRCMSRLARRLFADVIGTAYVEGEIAQLKDEQLPQAECEVNECKAALHEEPVQPLEPVNKEPLLTPEQHQVLLEIWKLCSDEGKKSIMDRLFYVGSQKFRDLKQIYYADMLDFANDCLKIGEKP